MFDESDVKTPNMRAALAGAAIKAYQAGAGTGLLSPGVFTAAKGFAGGRHRALRRFRGAGPDPVYRYDDVRLSAAHNLKARVDVLHVAAGLERDPTRANSA